MKKNYIFFKGNACFEYGKDYLGNDISSNGIWTKSAEECQVNCRITSNCEYWTWMSAGLCYKKYAKSQITNGYNAISGPKKCYSYLIGRSQDWIWVTLALEASGMSTMLIIFILYKKKRPNNSNQSSNNVDTSQDLTDAERSAQDLLNYFSNLSSRLEYTSDRPVQNSTSSTPNIQNDFQHIEPTVSLVENSFENENPPKYNYDPPTYEEAMKI